MIKNLTGGFGITVSGSINSDPYISPGSVGSGQVRWNSNTNCMEVNDGNMWKSLTWNYPTIELDANTKAIVMWAQKKMHEDAIRQSRIRDNPALQKAYEAIKRAEANFDILDKIAGECEVCEQVQSSP